MLGHVGGGGGLFSVLLFNGGMNNGKIQLRHSLLLASILQRRFCLPQMLRESHNKEAVALTDLFNLSTLNQAVPLADRRACSRYCTCVGARTVASRDTCYFSASKGLLSNDSGATSLQPPCIVVSAPFSLQLPLAQRGVYVDKYFSVWSHLPKPDSTLARASAATAALFGGVAFVGIHWRFIHLELHGCVLCLPSRLGMLNFTVETMTTAMRRFARRFGTRLVLMATDGVSRGAGRVVGEFVRKATAHGLTVRQIQDAGVPLPSRPVMLSEIEQAALAQSVGIIGFRSSTWFGDVLLQKAVARRSRGLFELALASERLDVSGGFRRFVGLPPWAYLDDLLHDELANKTIIKNMRYIYYIG